MSAEFGFRTFLVELFRAYNDEGVAYCILRNYEALPERLDSSDIDIMVEHSKRHISSAIITRLAERHGLALYSHYVDERFDQYYLFGRPAGDFFFLRLDFFYRSELYGVRLIDGKKVLSSRRPFKTFFVAEEVYQLLDKWLYLYLLNAELPAKYLSDFRLIVSGNIETVVKHSAEIFGGGKADTIIATIREHGFEALPKVGRYGRLRILLRNALRAPRFHLWHLPLFLYYRLKCLLFPCGEFISFSGPDGSGKTTVLKLAKEQLAVAFRMGEKSMFHFRPSVFPRIAELARTANLVSSVDDNYSVPHRAKPSGFFGSFMRLAYYAFDYFLGYFKVIRPILVRRELVISDRYFYDLIADPGRSRISLPFGILTAIFRFMPKPHTTFFILASPEKIRERKQELSADTIEALNRRYIELARKDRNLVVIENNGTPEKAAADIVDAVITRRAQRLGLMEPEVEPPVNDVSSNRKSVS
ncbi:MAG: hypothetical protein P8013_11095 [Candidatus Sulfobium sp.]|jgi:thymidylate kinase